MKKVILTGVTGSVGMALLDELLQNSVEVTIISRKNSERIKYVPRHKLVKLVECDFENLVDLKDDLPLDYDVFYHLAWAGSSVLGRTDINVQVKNIQYTLDAVELAHKLRCKRFIGAGSQAELGRVEGEITTNTPSKPDLPYGIIKLCAGQISREKCREYEMEHIWTRILSVYGPYTGKDSILIASISSFLQGESLEYTKGDQEWDYMYSRDAGRAFYLLGESGISGKTYYVASGNTQKLSEYLRILRDLIAPEVELKLGMIPYRDNQVMNLSADISDLQRDTGFRIKYTFEQGIKETINWVRKINE